MIQRVHVSTHSHPKVAAAQAVIFPTIRRCFNTQPPEGGCPARRNRLTAKSSVSTHSHPKVAACIVTPKINARSGFNTQPPEGGCALKLLVMNYSSSFNTQPPEGGCSIRWATALRNSGFNTQPPEGGCGEVLNKPYMLDPFQHTATRRWLRYV